MPEKVVEVNSLVKRYKDLIAVDNISFDVYKGEIFSLVGPNAAGKTTTVEILECLRKPTSGSAKVLGLDVLTEEKEIKKRIGVMPQNFNTFERLTVKENVELVATIYGIKHDIKELLELLGLWEVRNKKFGTLSGGMKRRVGVCMALVSDPELLFLDEPTTALDPKARRECWEIIKNLKKLGKTVFLTTHYMEEVEKLSDRASVILKGKVVATDQISTLISKYGGGVKVAVSGGKKPEEILRQFTQRVSRDDNNIIGLFQKEREAKKALAQLYQLEDVEIEVLRAGMDDVFFRLIGAKIDERGELV
ncbi:MAG: ABC transporter ATP-binding protein [Candidatus Thermoplasmatota archaeon]|nr:ABC transporter ATP-binding protein [Candidatus Thermoplasmatota archaeon]